MPAVAKKVPWAHIAAGNLWMGSPQTVCGELIQDAKEFLFKDVEHCLKFYGVENKHLQACAKCLDVARKKK